MEANPAEFRYPHLSAQDEESLVEQVKSANKIRDKAHAKEYGFIGPPRWTDFTFSLGKK